MYIYRGLWNPNPYIEIQIHMMDSFTFLSVYYSKWKWLQKLNVIKVDR